MTWIVIIAGFIGVFVFGVTLFMLQPVFGKNPEGQLLTKMSNAPNFKQGAFQNVEHTEVMKKGVSMFTVLKEFFNKPKTTVPQKAIPFVVSDLKNLEAATPTIVWFGHSSYLIKSRNFTVLVDPVFSGFASPVRFAGGAFPGSNHYQVKDMPSIDLLILTHDHYDHLDYQTILLLHPKVKKIVTSFGVEAHLLHWKIPAEKITSLHWWQDTLVTNDVHITATPARHFSGRGFVRAKTLWSSFVLKIHGFTLFVGGDSGYDQQFKKIGEQFGPFDVALLEAGQYGSNWPLIHMTPEETVQAAQDLRASVLFPVHWGKFALSNHAWNEPIERVWKAAVIHHQKVVSPVIGEPWSLQSDFTTTRWWN